MTNQKTRLEVTYRDHEILMTRFIDGEQTWFDFYEVTITEPGGRCIYKDVEIGDWKKLQQNLSDLYEIIDLAETKTQG